MKKPEKTMKPHMRIILDEMVDDPDPIAPYLLPWCRKAGRTGRLVEQED